MLFIGLTLKTPLCVRSLEIRLMVAYMATAGRKLRKCDPGNTYTRVFSKHPDPDSHYYNELWESVARYYHNMGFGDFSDKKIRDTYTKALAKGKGVRQTVDTWSTYGWTEYEHRRAGRRQAVKQFGMPAVVICGALLGINLPSVD